MMKTELALEAIFWVAMAAGGRLAGRLVCWLAGRLDGRASGRLAGRAAGWLACVVAGWACCPGAVVGSLDVGAVCVFTASWLVSDWASP